MTDRSSHAEIGHERQIRRRRGLPGGRAVVGALLVVGSAVAVFAAYLTSTAPPSQTWLVAATDIAAGHVISRTDLDVVAADIPTDQQATILRGFQLDEAVGTIATAAIDRGSFVVASMVVQRGGAAGELVSFSLPRERALAGDLGPGGLVDVVATFTDAGVPVTEYVVRGLEVTATEQLGGGVGAGAVLVTVRASDPQTVQQLLHALGNGSVYLVRPGNGGATPARYSRGQTNG